MQSTESTDSDEQDLRALFVKVTAALAGGDLTFPPPFDLATSAALAANIDTGDTAQALFDVTAQRDTSYRVMITAVAPDVPGREVINTTVAGTSLLVALLEGLIDEHLAALEGDPSHG